MPFEARGLEAGWRDIATTIPTDEAPITGKCFIILTGEQRLTNVGRPLSFFLNEHTIRPIVHEEWLLTQGQLAQTYPADA